MAKFTSKKINKTNVTIDDWLALKPYSTPTEHDTYYLGIAETVFFVLNINQDRVHYYDISKDNLREWACVLTSYFEDYMSNIGLWRTFLLNNKELHGVYLPFYDLTHYKFDELNKEDIMYLCWHYLSKLHEDWVFSPDYSWFKEIANELYILFDSEQHEAYNTSYYDTYFTIPDKSNFFETKEKLNWLALNSYLLGLENQRAYKKLEAEAIKTVRESNGKYDIDKVGVFLYSMKNTYLYTQKSSFNALAIPIWLAKLANCSEGKRKEIEELQYPHKGFYQYLSQDKDCLSLKEMKNDKIYKVSHKSAKFPKKFGEHDVIDITLVKWDKEWWVTGMLLIGEKTEKDIAKYLNSSTENSWILDEKYWQEAKESNRLLQQSFLEYFGANYVITKNRAEAEKKMNEFSDFHQSKINPKNSKKHDIKLTQIDKSMQNIAIFVDSEGLKISSGIFDLIELAKLNKFSDEDIEYNFIDVFTNCNSFELFCELLEKHQPKIFSRFPKQSEISILANKEYLLRMYSPQNMTDGKYPIIIQPVKTL